MNFYLKLLFSLSVCVNLHTVHAVNVDHEDATESPLTLSTYLNPTKGYTAWHAPDEKITITWPVYGDLNRKQTAFETVPGYEITVSLYGLCMSDYVPVVSELYQYNLNHQHPMYNDTFELKPGARPDAMSCVEYSGKRAFAFLNPQADTNTVDLDAFFNQLEADVYAQGVRYVLSLSRPGENAINALLKKRDFKSIAIVDDLDEVDTQTVLWMKNIKQSPKADASSFQLKWTTQLMNFPAEFHEGFGVFVRDASGCVQGGAYGQWHLNAPQPYAYINVFCMLESLRGKGFARPVMHALENLMKEYSVRMLELGTCDFQAPWFYEKIGYKKTMTLPFLSHDKSMNPINSYGYRKNLI